MRIDPVSAGQAQRSLSIGRPTKSSQGAPTSGGEPVDDSSALELTEMARRLGEAPGAASAMSGPSARFATDVSVMAIRSYPEAALAAQANSRRDGLVDLVS